MVHIGEDGRPDSSFRYTQVSKGYLSEDIYEEYMKRTQLAADPLPDYYKNIAKAHLVKISYKES